MKKSQLMGIILLFLALFIYWLCFGTEALRWIDGPLIEDTNDIVVRNLSIIP